jgi:integrase
MSTSGLSAHFGSKEDLQLALSGLPAHVAAARLGHADPAITLRVYAHVIRAAEAAAAGTSPRP